MHVNSFVADISRTQFLPHIPIIFVLIAQNRGNMYYSIIPALIQHEIQAQNNLHYIMKSISQQTHNDILSLDQGKSCQKNCARNWCALLHSKQALLPASFCPSQGPGRLAFKAKLHYNMPCHLDNQHWEG